MLLSSIGHKLYVKGWDLGDLHWRQRAYVPFLAYGASKMANLLMAKELAKRWGRGGRAACRPTTVQVHDLFQAAAIALAACGFREPAD